MLINQPDVGRYANRPSAALFPQFFSMFICKVVVFFLGVVTAAASAKLFGKTVWNVWDLCSLILTSNFTPGWRAGIFLFSVCQCLGTLATNVFANSIPFGVDLSGCFPKWINIVRGQFICATLSWAICPWLILTSGAKFVSFLGSYTFFMASVLGVMVADYYVLRRGNLHVPSMFTITPGSLYMNSPKGYNVKALVSWVAGSVICIPGLAAVFGTGDPTGVAAKLYNTGFILSFAVGFTCHTVLGLIWRERVFPAEHEDTPLKFEYLAETDGYYPGEAAIEFGRGIMHGTEVDEMLHRKPSRAVSEDDKYLEKDDTIVSAVPVALPQGA